MKKVQFSFFHLSKNFSVSDHGIFMNQEKFSSSKGNTGPCKSMEGIT